MRGSGNTIHKMTGRAHGFTLIEAAVVLFLFSVITITFYQTWVLGMDHILNTKKRLGATALANQKIEMMRSLQYDSIGTKRWNGSAWVYGVPAGDILQDETVSASGGSFDVHTDVSFVDDAYDGTLGGSPNDAAYTDYKRIRVEVSWGDGGPTKEVALFATIAQDGVESASNTGVLSINVLNAAGDGVSQASVRVVNSAEGIDFTTDTDSTGNLMVLGADPGTENYELTVSKSGYYEVGTFDPYPASAFHPIDVHASVVAGAVNQKSIVIDETSDLSIETEDPFGTAIPDINFDISGGRQIGTEPTYDFSESASTDGNGVREYQDRSYGQYFFVLDSGETGYEIFHASAETDPDKETIDVVPGEDKTGRIVLMSTSLDSLLVTVTENVAGTPIPNASVKISNATLAYDVTLQTNANGQAFFPSSLPELVSGDYDLEVSATGYDTSTETVTISGAGLEEETVSMNPE